jgi:hypothetical protein
MQTCMLQLCKTKISVREIIITGMKNTDRDAAGVARFMEVTVVLGSRNLLYQFLLLVFRNNLLEYLADYRKAHEFRDLDKGGFCFPDFLQDYLHNVEVGEFVADKADAVVLLHSHQPNMIRPVEQFP